VSARHGLPRIPPFQRPPEGAAPAGPAWRKPSRHNHFRPTDRIFRADRPIRQRRPRRRGHESVFGSAPELQSGL